MNFFTLNQADRCWISQKHRTLGLSIRPPVLLVRQTFNNSKTQMWLLSRKHWLTIAPFLSDHEQGIAGLTCSISSKVKSSSPSNRSNKSSHLFSPCLSFLSWLHNERFCLTSLLNGSYHAVTGMFHSEVYVSSICQYYAQVQVIKFNSVWTEKTGQLRQVQLNFKPFVRRAIDSQHRVQHKTNKK